MKPKPHVVKGRPPTPLETARRLGMSRSQARETVAFAKKVVKPSGRGIYTAPILVGLTPEQREIVKAAAKREHRSVGEWARLVLVYQAEIIEARAKAMARAIKESVR